MVKDKITVLSDQVAFCSLCLIAFFIGFSNAGVESLFGFALLAFIVKKIVTKSKWINILPYTEFNLPIFIFILANVLSLINSKQYIIKSLDALFFKWLEYIAIYFIVVNTVNSKKRTIIITVILLISCALIGVDGIFQKINGVDFLRHKSFMPVLQNNIVGITASFNHYNDLAGYLVTLLPLIICIYFFSKPISKPAIFFLAVELVLIYSCLLLTFSRGGWFGFIASLIFIFIFIPGNKSLVLTLILIFSFIVFFPLETKSRLLTTFMPRGDAQRFRLWYDAFRIIKNNPILGKGVGTFMDNLVKYDPVPAGQYAHNCYLQIWAEAGIFALLSFLWFIILLFKRGIKILKKKEDYLLLGVLSGIFGFLVHSFFDTHLYSLRLAVLFWFMAGFAVAIINLEKITGTK